MQKIDLEVIPRDKNDKKTFSNLNQMRRAGYVPAVMYGHGDPINVAIEIRHFLKSIHTKAGINALFTVNVNGKKELSIIKSVQKDVLSHKPIHVDFQRINVNEKIEATIPIHTVGEASGVKNEGGVLEHIQRDVEIRCLPDDMVSEIEIDVSPLKLHDSIKVADLQVPKGVEILTPGDHIVVNIVMPRVEEEPTPVVEGAAPAEPEVLAKGKEKEGATKEDAAAPAAAPEKAKEKEKK